MHLFKLKSQKTILSATFVMFVANALNAILGIFKNRLLADQFGVSTDLALFYTADRIPTLIYSILTLGAVSTVFIPIFSEELRKNREEALDKAVLVLNTIFAFFIGMTSLVILFAPSLIRLLGAGTFSEAQIQQGTSLMRIMLLSQIILVAGSLLSSVLQSFKLFVVPAVAPIAYNIGMIGGIIFLSDKFGILGPTYGTVLGALLHFLIQLPFIRQTGVKTSSKINFKDPLLKQIIQLAPPRIGSVLIANLLGTINNSLAILISSAAVVYLKFANQLQTFPVTLFGASIAAASLPTLSEETDKKDLSKFTQTLLTAFHQMAYFVLPASAILLILRVPIVRIVYGVSAFPWDATISTARLLGIYTLAIFPQSANYLFSRAFYALKDTGTPMKISLVSITMNVLLSLFFIYNLNLGVWSLALSYVITSYFDTLAMLKAIADRTKEVEYTKLFRSIFKIGLATLLMAITLYLPIKLFDQVIFDTTRTIDLLMLTGLAGFSGIATYIFITEKLKIPEVALFYKLLAKLKPEKLQITQGNTDSF